jgi:WD40 repeat protein
VLSAGADGVLRYWDVSGARSGTELLVRDIDAHTEPITGCAMGFVTNRAITCSRDRTIKLWDLSNGRCVDTYYGDAPFLSLAMASEAPEVAAADTSGAVTLLLNVDGFKKATRAAT